MVFPSSFLVYLPLLVLVGLPLALYYYTLYTNSYWKRNNIPFIPGKPFVGNLLDALLFRRSIGHLLEDVYYDKRSKDKSIVGINFFHKPILIVKDLDLVKNILVKDFSSFIDRHASSDIHSDLLGTSTLFFVDNPAWKIIRSRLTPFFSSGKIKQMFHLMNNVGNEMNETMLSFKVNEKSQSFSTEIKELCARYTTDVIASCAYGIEANSLKDPDSEFRRNGKRVFDVNLFRAIELTSMFLLPEIVPYFKFKLFSKETSSFIRDSINYIMGEREKSGSTRNDLIDTLITLKNEDKFLNSSTSSVVFQGDVLIAQAASFFAAGFETSSAIMSFGLYELAFQVDLQMKLRQEIKETLQKSQGTITYDNVNSMVYLNMIVQEMLRMYPPLPFLDRICTNKQGYSLQPYDNFVIQKGLPIMIPIFAIQRDPKYWPNPNKFDPERFSPEMKQNIVPYSYLPFGVGPHNCIGDRFGLLQTKIGIINFFKNHYVTPSEQTPRNIIYEPRALLMQAKGGIVLNVVREPIS